MPPTKVEQPDPPQARFSKNVSGPVGGVRSLPHAISILILTKGLESLCPAAVFVGVSLLFLRLGYMRHSEWSKKKEEITGEVPVTGFLFVPF